MEIYFSQIYIEAEATFPLSNHFQKFLSKEITSLAAPSEQFIKQYGEDWNLIFRISAKKDIDATMICGPTAFKKQKDVEFTIFLPFKKIERKYNKIELLVVYLLQGVCSVLGSLGIATENVVQTQESLIKSVCSNPAMLKNDASRL